MGESFGKYVQKKFQEAQEKRDPLLGLERKFNAITDEFAKVRVAGKELAESLPSVELKDSVMEHLVNLNNLHIILVDGPNLDKKNPDKHRERTLHFHARNAGVFKDDVSNHEEAVFGLLGVDWPPVPGDSYRNPAGSEKYPKFSSYYTALVRLEHACGRFLTAYEDRYPLKKDEWDPTGS